MFQSELKNLPQEDICILVRPDNHSWSYLCECGQASLLTVKECQNLRVVFVSHTHFDHFVDFDKLIRHQIGIGRRVIICGPEGIARNVQAKLLGYTWNLIEPDAVEYEIREIIEPGLVRRFLLQPNRWELQELDGMGAGPIFKDKDFEVTYTLLDHRIPTVAWRFDEAEKISIDLSGSGLQGGPWVAQLKVAFEANDPEQILEIGDETKKSGELFHLLDRKQGHSLGVIMDHTAHAENHAKIRDLFRDCAKVYIESFYQESDQELAEKNAHSWSRASGWIMRECGVKQAIPVHFSRRYEAGDRERVVAEFYQAFTGN